MELPDMLKGLGHIGSWEIKPWGCRWELTNEEVDKAIHKIDVERNATAALGGGATLVFALATVGMSAPFIGGATACLLVCMSY